MTARRRIRYHSYKSYRVLRAHIKNEIEVNGVTETQRPDQPSSSLSSADASLIQALRAGDEDAFTGLVEQYFASMVRIAMIYVSDQAVAEEVVQDTWIAVLRGLERFEGRSSLKTWIFTILTNRAKTRAQREGRYVPLDISDDREFEPAVPSERFRPAEDGPDADHWYWENRPASWETIPEDHLLSRETLTFITKAIESLPHNQCEVIRLRDVEGFSSSEVCNILGLSETNQRVLLHRARARVRNILEDYLSNK